MYRVLVLDDYQPNLQLYATVVKQVPDCEPFTFNKPDDALFWAARTDVALAIADYNMADMNGLDFVRALRALPGRENTRIIMLTGVTDKSVRKEAAASGVNRFLSKPVDTGEFVLHIGNLVKAYVDHQASIRANKALREHIDAALRTVTERERETIERLFKAVEARDPATARHMRLARDFAVAIATELNPSREDLDTLRWSALVYDIGKLSLPESLLGSELKLNQPSRELIRTHAKAGADILSGSASPLLQNAARIAHHHHEYFNGEGYPDGLKGDDIPLHARIVAVADTLAALIHNRPYRKAMTFGQAGDQIKRESGLHFDPLIVAAFESAKHTLTTIARANLTDETHAAVSH